MKFEVTAEPKSSGMDAAVAHGEGSGARLEAQGSWVTTSTAPPSAVKEVRIPEQVLSPQLDTRSGSFRQPGRHIMAGPGRQRKAGALHL